MCVRNLDLITRTKTNTMNFLLLTTEDMLRVQAVITYARENMLYIDDLLDVKNNARKSPVEMPECCVVLSDGIKCVYTEFTIPDKGLYKYLAIALPDPKTVVSPDVAEFLMEMFGIAKPSVGEVEVSDNGQETLVILDLPASERTRMGIK